MCSDKNGNQCTCMISIVFISGVPGKIHCKQGWEPTSSKTDLPSYKTIAYKHFPLTETP